MAGSGLPPAFYQDRIKRAEERLLRGLRSVLGPLNADTTVVIEEALGSVDWTDPEGWLSVTAALNQRLELLREVVPGEVEPLLARAVTEMAGLSRSACVADLTASRRLGRSALGGVFGSPDPETLRRLHRVRRIVAKQAWTEHIADFSDKTRGVLLQAAREGWTRGVTGDALYRMFSPLTESGPAAHESYWNVVGSYWLHSARNRASLDTYHEAGITRYRILAVMDQRTSAVCAALNGTVFSVGDQVERENRACDAETIQELRSLSPWLSGGAEEGEAVGFRRGRSFVDVAHRAGEKFRLSGTPGKLQGLGVGMPPYHARCRTTIVAV